MAGICTYEVDGWINVPCNYKEVADMKSQFSNNEGWHKYNDANEYNHAR